MAQYKVLQEQDVDIYPITHPDAVRDEQGISVNDKLTALQTEVGKKYTKPASGIPSTDLSSSVQTSISRADEIYNDYINAQNLM